MSKASEWVRLVEMAEAARPPRHDLGDGVKVEVLATRPPLIHVMRSSTGGHLTLDVAQARALARWARETLGEADEPATEGSAS